MGRKPPPYRGPDQYCLNFNDERLRQAYAGQLRYCNLMLFLMPPEPEASATHRAARFHCQMHSTGSRPYPAHLLHVSALCLGAHRKPPDDIIKKAASVAEALHVRPIKFTFDRTELFGGRKHIALAERGSNDDFHAFVQILARAMWRGNVPHVPNRRPTAHMTIIYDRKATPIMPLKQPISWTAEELILAFSWNGQGRHEVFGRWRLSPEAAAYSKRPEQLPMDLEGRRACLEQVVYD